MPSLHRLSHSLRLWWQTWCRLLLAVGYTSTSRRILGVFATPMSTFFLLKIPLKCCLFAYCCEIVSIFSLLGSRMAALFNCHALTSPLAVECLDFRASLPTKELLSFRFANKIWLTRQTKTWNSLIQTCLETSTAHFFDWMTFHLGSQSKVLSLHTFKYANFSRLEICWLAYIFFICK